MWIIDKLKSLFRSAKKGSSKAVTSIVIVGFLLAILAPVAITQLADMDTDGTSNNTEFAFLASLPAIIGLFLLLGGGYMIGRKTGLV